MYLTNRVKLGGNMKKYKHFKGGVYTFICLAKHSETGETLVIYKDRDENTFARPYEMFFDKVEHEGKQVQRFIEL